MKDGLSLILARTRVDGWELRVALTLPLSPAQEDVMADSRRLPRLTPGKWDSDSPCLASGKG
jgi:hypothetical protein